MKNLGPLIGLAAVYVLFCLWAGEPFYSNFNRVTVPTQSVTDGFWTGPSGLDHSHEAGKTRYF